MIANEQEYIITKRAAQQLMDALHEMDTDPQPIDSRQRQLLRSAVASQLADLRTELGEFEARQPRTMWIASWAALSRVPHAIRIRQPAWPWRVPALVAEGLLTALAVRLAVGMVRRLLDLWRGV
jgi:hypothetical protein